MKITSKTKSKTMYRLELNRYEAEVLYELLYAHIAAPDKAPTLDSLVQMLRKELARNTSSYQVFPRLDRLKNDNIEAAPGLRVSWAVLREVKYYPKKEQI